MPNNQTAFIVKLAESMDPDEAAQTAEEIHEELSAAGFDVDSVEPWKRGPQASPTSSAPNTAILDIFSDPFGTQSYSESE